MTALFTFNEDRARQLLAAFSEDDMVPGRSDYLEPINRWEDGPDSIHKTVEDAIELGAIERANDQACMAVYPISTAEPEPLLAINTGDAGPLVLDGHDWRWPDDEDLPDTEATVAVLRWTVERGNELARDAHRRPESLAILDHAYNGSAARLGPSDDGTVFEHDTADHYESISGAFRVLCWLDSDRAVVGNGESPETVWVTQDAPERVA